ncbi:MAG: N-acetyltransferase, partial [candidate division WOR-3 bacterium]
MSGVTIRRVVSGSDLERFIRFPFRLYQDDPYWIPPLRSDLANTLTPGRNPFWEHAERALYLAERGGVEVGRIAAIIDHNYNKYHKTAIGYFGYFESVDEPQVAEMLFDAVAEFCRARGMEVIYGPANPSMNDEAGLLVGPFDGPPYIKMSYNFPYYPRLLEHCGFSKVKDLYAYDIPMTQPVPRKLIHVMERLKRKPGLVVRPVDLKHLARDLKFIKEVYNDAWSENWDFAPMTDEEIDSLARQLKPIIQPGICPLVFYQGEPAGMCIALPDYNQVLKRLKGSLWP